MRRTHRPPVLASPAVRLWAIVLAAAAVTVGAPGSAQAGTYCVAVSAPGCEARDSAAAAFAAAAAAPGADTILLGRVSETDRVADASGEPVRVVGAGRAQTALAGGLDLGEPESSATALTVRDRLQLAGTGSDLGVEGRVDLRGALLSAVVDGRLVAAGEARLASVVVRGDGGVTVGSGELAARQVTVFGTGPVGVRAGPGATASLTDSIVAGFDAPVQGAVTARGSHLVGDPGFMAPPGDLGLRADSALVDGGDPAPLTAQEPQEDALGDVRAVDGDGDGTARRDVGALERRPPPRPGEAGNVLANPGAEEGRAATDDTSSFAPPGWTRAGGFTAVRYGAEPFPTLAAAAARRAGRAVLAGGPARAASATQVVDVSEHAPEIDGRHGAVRLAALLGGFRQSPDRAIVTAEFRAPSGAAIGALALDGVTPAARANATMLAPRGADAAIPPLTRTIAVTVRTTAPSGRYNDAYADDVALVPRTTPLKGVPRARRTARRPFAGVALLRRWARVDRRGRAWVRLGCPSRTAGRCGGVATLARGRAAVIGGKRFVLKPGWRRTLRIPLVRRALRGKRRLKAHLHAATRDRQGLTRTTVAPLRLERRR
jgi:hypothetical protein